MVQDSSSSGAAKTEVVDLDDLEVSILIICKNPSQLKVTAAFLSRRGWPTHCVNGVSAAIEYVAENRPDFVLVSFNHPSPAVLKLPDLITQTFNVTCVGFVEAVDAASAQKLNQLKIKHKIFGQPSGPNFHRGIRRILAEKFDVKLEEPSADEAEKNPGSITVRGGKPAETSGWRTSENSSTASKDLAAAAAPSPSPEERNSDLIESGKYTMGRKRKNLKEVMNINGDNAAGANKLFGNNVNPGAGPGANVPDLLGILKHSLFGETGAEKTEPSVLEKAVEGAINQVCEKNQTLSPIPIQRVRRLAVYPVDSTTMPGYLVVAFETERSDEQKSFLKSAEASLQRNFGLLSVAAKLENGFWLDFPAVPFDEWVDGEATFTFKVDHGGAQLGVAFFSTSKPLPKARLSSEKGMHTIELDEISTEQPVNFKAYLHFKKNQKYFLYLRNGRRLQPEQKIRLKGHKVSNIFMKSVDVENLRVFLAAVYLRGTIKNQDQEDVA